MADMTPAQLEAERKKIEEAAAQILPLKQVAKEAGVNLATAYRWVQRGELRSITAAGSAGVWKPDLDAFLAERNTWAGSQTGK